MPHCNSMLLGSEKHFTQMPGYQDYQDKAAANHFRHAPISELPGGQFMYTGDPLQLQQQQQQHQQHQQQLQEQQLPVQLGPMSPGGPGQMSPGGEMGYEG